MLVLISMNRDYRIIVNTSTWCAVGVDEGKDSFETLRDFWTHPCVKLDADNQRTVKAIIKGKSKPMVTQRHIYGGMPFDRNFGDGFVHATGFEYFDGNNRWYEYSNDYQNFYYG